MEPTARFFSAAKPLSDRDRAVQTFQTPSCAPQTPMLDFSISGLDHSIENHSPQSLNVLDEGPEFYYETKKERVSDRFIPLRTGDHPNFQDSQAKQELAGLSGERNQEKQKYLERLVDTLYGENEESTLQNLSEALPDDSEAFSPLLRWPEENNPAAANRKAKAKPKKLLKFKESNGRPVIRREP